VPPEPNESIVASLLKWSGILGLRPVMQNYATIKYGNRVTIPGVIAGTGQTVPLLRADIREAHSGKSFEAGAWVLTLSTQIEFDGTPAPSCNPLIARVSMGDGAISQIIEVDIQRGAAFQIPSGSVQVDAFLEAPPFGFNIPATQTVFCQIHRGFSASKPTRTFYFADPGGALGVAQTSPPMATHMNAFGVGAVLIGTLYIFRAGGGALSSLETYTGVDLFNAAKVGTGISIPSAAQSVTTTFPAAGGALELLQFTIDI
jgi:hypothetical protein